MVAPDHWRRAVETIRKAGGSLLTSPPAEPRPFADDSNEFAFAMYGQLRERPGNLFFSPLSVRVALCMAQAGARGETAAQMRKALRISSSDETLQIAVAETVRSLNASGGGRYEMAVANSLWGQEGATLRPEYLDLVSRHFGGAMNLVDFRGAAEAARMAVNQWVEDRTRQKIRGLIPPGGLSADTRLVLANAIYFKGMWRLQFWESETREEPFWLEDGGTVRAPLMCQYEDVRYLQANGYQAVELDYQGGDLSMVVLLPDRRDGLRDLETALSSRLFRDCVAGMRYREVKLFLPRFEMTRGTNMKDALAALGMSLAFSPSEADFSAINGHKPPDAESLFVSAVLHEAFVEVHERGTEAAAATLFDVEMTLALEPPPPPPPPPIFRADHPFLFAIYEQRSGAIVFLGRVFDPTGES